jgi:NMD protein affecting ribosome stability and mRNA decay
MAAAVNVAESALKETMRVRLGDDESSVDAIIQSVRDRVDQRCGCRRSTSSLARARVQVRADPNRFSELESKKGDFARALLASARL